MKQKSSLIAAAALFALFSITPIAGLCTSTSTSYCFVEVTLQDSIKSKDGDILDGDGNGQPGGVYRHKFHRGMVQP